MKPIAERQTSSERRERRARERAELYGQKARHYITLACMKKRISNGNTAESAELDAYGHTRSAAHNANKLLPHPTATELATKAPRFRTISHLQNKA